MSYNMENEPVIQLTEMTWEDLSAFKKRKRP